MSFAICTADGPLCPQGLTLHQEKRPKKNKQKKDRKLRKSSRRRIPLKGQIDRKYMLCVQRRPT